MGGPGAEGGPEGARGKPKWGPVCLGKKGGKKEKRRKEREKEKEKKGKKEKEKKGEKTWGPY